MLKLGEIKMSAERKLTFAGFADKIFGFIIIILGIVLTYFAYGTDFTLVDVRMFRPIGLFIALIGALLLISKEA